MFSILLDEDDFYTGNIFTDSGTSSNNRYLDSGTYTTDAGGSVTISSNGDYTYNPPANYNGSDSFTYTIYKKNGQVDSTDSASITVSPVNDSPLAADDAFQGTEGITLSANVLVDNGNGADSDIDGDSLAVIAETFATSQGSTVIISANGDFTYEPASGFSGADSFTYTLTDGNGGTDTGNVDINIVPASAENTDPVAEDDVISATEDIVLNGNVIADNGNGSDHDDDGDLLTVTAQTITTANNGTVVLLENGDFSYTPATDFNGSDSFTYTLNDGRGGADTAAVTINVASVNDTPLAMDDSLVVSADTAFSGNVLLDNGGGADSDIESETLSVTAQTITTDAGGTAVLEATGYFTYTPAAGYTGTDSFTYILSDTDGGTDTGLVTLDISNRSLTFTTAEDTGATGNIYAETSARDNRDYIHQTTITTDGGGTVALSTNGDYSYTPVQDFYGSDSFQYNLYKSNGQISSTETSVITVTAVNDAPVAFDDSFTATEDVVLTGNVIADNGSGADNDTDLDTLNVTPQTITTTVGGTVELQANGDFTYTPAAEYSGTDSFSYTISDSEGLSDTGTVTITIAPVVDILEASEEGGEIQGNPDADIINGDAGIDIFYGNGGDDTLKGQGGEDLLYGGEGNDIIYGNPGNDILSGEAGNDTLMGHDGEDTIYGGIDDDIIYGGIGADTLYGNSGTDKIDGGADDDEVYGDTGDDYLYGRLGNDTLDGGDGNDRIFGHEDDDVLKGGIGQDYLNGGDGFDLADYSSASTGITLSLSGRVDEDGDGLDDDWLTNVEAARGSAFNDFMAGDYGANTFYGGLGDDIINGLAGDDVLYGEDGSDSVDGGDGNDTLYGGAGDDLLYGRLGNDLIYGEDDADRLFGHEGQDTLDGGTGDDYINGGGDADILSGGAENDSLYGESGDDTLFGGSGDDLLNGGTGNDFLFGEYGLDTLYGGEGDDLLVGGDGKDKLNGGAGADTFGFTDISSDAVKDFDIAEDRLNITDILSGYDPLTSDISAFVTINHCGYGFDVLVNEDGVGTRTSRAARVFTDIDDSITAQDLLDQGVLIAGQSVL